MKVDGVTAITMILIASLAIDRIVTAIMFLLPFLHLAPDPGRIADPVAHAASERKYKLMYFLIAGLLGILVLAFYGQIRVLTAIGLKIDPLLDTLLTGIVLVGGADRIAALLKAPGAGGAEKPQPQPIQITGKLVLEEGTAQKIMGQRAE